MTAPAALADARLLRESDRLYVAATAALAGLKAWQAEFEATGEEWSIANLVVRMLLGSEALRELRHAAEAYSKARGL